MRKVAWGVVEVRQENKLKQKKLMLGTEVEKKRMNKCICFFKTLIEDENVSK